MSIKHSWPERLIETIVDGKVVESHVAPAEEKWSNYDLEFVVDQTKWDENRQADSDTDADEEFDFPTTVEVKEDGFNQQIPWGASGTQMEIYEKVEDMLKEWLNLVLNNDCKDRKVRFIISVTEAE
jgi:hypothetical protein